MKVYTAGYGHQTAHTAPDCPMLTRRPAWAAPVVEREAERLRDAPAMVELRLTPAPPPPTRIIAWLCRICSVTEVPPELLEAADDRQDVVGYQTKLPDCGPEEPIRRVRSRMESEGSDA